jgi:hypothetical protein
MIQDVHKTHGLHPPTLERDCLRRSLGGPDSNAVCGNAGLAREVRAHGAPASVTGSTHELPTTAADVEESARRL